MTYSSSLQIGAAGDYNLQIGNNIYRLLDLYSKTIYATKPLNVYTTVAAKKIATTLKAGDPIGTVRGYYPAGRGGAKKNYILVGPSSKDIKAIEYDATNFSEDKLLQQGVPNAKQSAEEMKKLQEDSNTPWYMKITKQVLPWAAGGLGLYLFINSRKKNG